MPGDIPPLKAGASPGDTCAWASLRGYLYDQRISQSCGH